MSSDQSQRPHSAAEEAIPAAAERNEAPESREANPPAGSGVSFRCGFIALAGKPNAGKSTLVNAIVGGKLAIVTPKAQTTRDRILGFHTTDDCQAIFVDMPGLIDAKDKFNEALMDIASEALSDVDICYHLVDSLDPDPAPPHIVAALTRLSRPIYLVYTHCDLLPNHQEPAQMPESLTSLYKGTFAISGTQGVGIGELLAKTLPLLPEGPALYPPEDITDRSMRFLAAEIVREKVFLHCEQEIPYGVACETEEYHERPGQTDYIRVTIFVERDSHKRIVIGAGGQVLKKVGAEARADIEKLIDKAIFLDLWVKVRRNWRKSENDLRYFGYHVEKKKGKRGGR